MPEDRGQLNKWQQGLRDMLAIELHGSQSQEYWRGYSWLVPEMSHVLPSLDFVTKLFQECNNGCDQPLQELASLALQVVVTVAVPCPLIRQLVRAGANVNTVNSDGRTPLHLLIKGCRGRDLSSSEEGLRALLELGADVHVADRKGDTPLLYLRKLLKSEMYSAAAQLADVLLAAGADPKAVNRKGHSILCISVSFLDNSYELTRLLVNRGSCVWNSDEQSAFTHFLKAVIRQRQLSNCWRTLDLLSRLMSEQPLRMKQHVMRTMFRNARSYKVLGPVFLELKLNMMRYWTQPQPLTHLCWKTIRRSVGSRRILTGVKRLGLPPRLQNYVLME